MFSALPQFAPNYAFYNPDLYNHQATYSTNTQHLNRLHPDYELYPESMLATQPHGSAAFFQLGQPIQTPQLAHSFHGFLKQESEPVID